MTFDFTPYLTAAIMLLGILVGTLISPRINHQINTQHSRKDLIFKKRLEYFEKIAETIEQNKRLYHHAIGKINSSKNNKEVMKVIDELKTNRKNFLIKSSPLYFEEKVLGNFSIKIKHFVMIEKQIFHEVSKINEKDKEEREALIESLEEGMKRLNKKGDEIILDMRKELSR
ncbi:Uncharacterised protein [uncultured archaeon]|nr:Uncharacterised protein [uncultured archaeon]